MDCDVTEQRHGSCPALEADVGSGGFSCQSAFPDFECHLVVLEFLLTKLRIMPGASQRGATRPPLVGKLHLRVVCGSRVIFLFRN